MEVELIVLEDIEDLVDRVVLLERHRQVAAPQLRISLFGEVDERLHVLEVV